MDDTQQSRASDAAATRKRRSSILKSQRPPRAPLSELEFNVATPTDTGKSRRVSFSKRTGVAEFVTNEATTTWKNFYEEHNKTLESSGNESEINGRGSVPHLGKHLFEEQFQEFEAIDFLSIKNGHSNLSIEKVEFENNTQCFDGLPKGGSNIEFSNITATESTNKLFGNDIVVSAIEDVSGKIGINFSEINALESDDLDEIQRDVERQAISGRNVVCAGPSNIRNISEYIEVNLNTTHAVIESDNVSLSDDMSITDIIDHAHMSNQEKETRNINYDNNMDISMTQALPSNIITDKNEDLCTYNVDCDISMTQAVPANLILQNNSSNDDSILPNTKNITKANIEDVENEFEKQKTIVYEDGDISMTQAMPSNINEPKMTNISMDANKQKAIVYEDGDISMTQAVPSNIKMPNLSMDAKHLREFVVYQSNICTLDRKEEKEDVYDDMDLGEKLKGNAETDNIIAEICSSSTNLGKELAKPVTKILPSQPSLPESSELSVKDKLFSDDLDEIQNDIERQASYARNITCGPSDVRNISDYIEVNLNTTHAALEPDKKVSDMSITNIIDNALLSHTKNETKTNTDDNMDISMTQVLPSNIITEKNDDLCTHNEDCDISMTQAVPANLILQECSANNGSISLGIKNENDEDVEEKIDKQKTIVYEDGNISMTQALPSKLIEPNKANNDEDVEEKIEKQKTIVYEDGNISMTQALPSKLIEPNKANNDEDVEEKIEKQKTIVYEDGNISMTQALPSKLIEPNMTNNDEDVEEKIEKQKTIVYEDGNISVTRALPSKLIEPNMANNDEDVEEKIEKQKTIVYEDGNITMTQALPSKLIEPNMANLSADSMRLRKYVVYQNNACTLTHKEEKVDVYAITDIEEKTNADAETENYFTEICTSSTDLAKTPAMPEIAVPTSLPSLPESSEPSVKDKSCSYVNIELHNYSSPPRKNDKILDHLLNMNDSVIEEVDKGIIARPTNGSRFYSENDSHDSLFYIIQDSSLDTAQKSEDEEPKEDAQPKKTNKIKKSIMEIQFENNLQELKRKMLELQERNESLNNRHYQEIISPSYETDEKFCKDVDSTKDLVEMLSTLTDNEDKNVNRKSVNPIPSRRTSIVTRRSLAVTREDLMNNISLASALLERPCGDDSDEKCSSDDDKSVSSKTDPHSPEVVKTLRFEDDETISESDSKVLEFSPLQKSARGEPSNQETKRKSDVIPTYLKDVTDNLKALMNDLVKPLQDTIPFNTGVGTEVKHKNNSRSIQANLVTSSQVDLDPEPYSDPETSMNARRLKGIMKHNNSSSAPSESESLVDEKASTGYVVTWNAHDDSRKEEADAEDEPDPPPVIVFDPMNPLNNVLIAPIDPNKVHRYNPLPSPPPLETPVQSKHMIPRSSYPENNQVKFQDADDVASDITMESEERISKHYNVHAVIPRFMEASKGIVNRKSMDSNNVANLNTSVKNPLTIDQAIGTGPKSLKSITMNTTIEMQDNKQLLENSSSLTLVDDSADEMKNKSNKDVDYSEDSQSSKSRLQYICKEREITDSETNSADEERQEISSKKRKYIKENPDEHRFCTLSAFDVLPPTVSTVTSTPSTGSKSFHDSPPKTKAKMNVSPKADRLSAGKSPTPRSRPKNLKHRLSQSDNNDRRSDKSKAVPSKSSVKDSPHNKKKPSPKKFEKRACISPGPVTVIQRVSLEPCVPVKESSLRGKASELFSSDVSSEISGSKGDGQCLSTDASKETGLCMEWRPELVHEPSSKDLIAEAESAIDVVSQLRALPFLGSCECEWEFASTEEWRFVLLHGRLNLIVGLEPTREAELWGRVRADTRVTDVRIESAIVDKKNAAGVLCVQFAAEAMRMIVNQYRAGRCERAGGVPALVRRCASLARVALRWRRVMHDCWLRLAYELSPDGHLQLKVANIPLRAVWEVSLHIELVAEERAETPWPRAGCLRVTPVIGDVTVPPRELARVAARVRADWGHAPKTLMKIFRYLKNKTHAEDSGLSLLTENNRKLIRS